MATAAQIQDDINDLAFAHSHTIPMRFYPDAWRAAINSNHQWVSTDFPPTPRNTIPANPGVYAFVVHSNLFDFPFAAGLFYIGKATCLYDRIGAYIGEQNKRFVDSSRPHVWRMVNQWKGHLLYFYTITADVASAEALEEKMISAFRPHFNRQFEATVSQTVRAF
jgi:excinuclease UvrABC nuclease subunit